MATRPTRSTGAGAALWRPGVVLLLDYVRWTQLVPMVMAWAFLLIMVVALVVTNFQDQTRSVLESGVVLYESVFGPLEPIEEPVEKPIASDGPSADTGLADGPADGAVHFDDESLRPWVLRIWALLALVGWLLGLFRSWLFGPREPATLPTKLARAAIAAGIASGICFACWLFGSERFNGGSLGWIALFIGAPALVWFVSAWSLSLSHLLDHLGRRITPAKVRTDAVPPQH